MTFILGFYERMYFEQLSGEDADYYNERSDILKMVTI